MAGMEVKQEEGQLLLPSLDDQVLLVLPVVVPPVLRTTHMGGAQEGFPPVLGRSQSGATDSPSFVSPRERREGTGSREQRTGRQGGGVERD